MNHLLASLPSSLREALAPTDALLARGQVLCELEAPMRQLVFPHTAVVSAVVPLREGGEPEAGLVGCDGAVGSEAALGMRVSTARWIVQIPGSASVVPMGRVQGVLQDRELKAEADVLRNALVAFGHAFTAQVMRTAACNVSHVAERRLVRWLLLCADRLPEGPVRLTQDFASQMLGMARPRVSLIAAGLQREGLIEVQRGALDIRDFDGLLARSCECHAAVRRAYSQVLPYRHQCGHAFAFVPDDSKAAG